MAKSPVSKDNQTHSRFTDLINEPNRFLSPIKGYQNKPLVSIERAVKPISHFFDDIDAYVWIAKENCEFPSDDLTPDESASIHLYTMEFNPGPSLYTVLNKTLRAEERQDLKPWFLFLKLFFTAVYKLPSHALTIWRGMREVDLSSEYKVGRKVVWWGVSSCTENLKVLENEQFLGKQGVRTMCCVECRNGKRIGAHSYYQDREEEVILMPGTYFQVTSLAEPAPKLHIIHLKEVQSPHTLVEPPFPIEIEKQNESEESVKKMTTVINNTVKISNTSSNQSTDGNNVPKTSNCSSSALVKTDNVVDIPEADVELKPETKSISSDSAQSEISIQSSTSSSYPKYSSLHQEQGQKWKKREIATIAILVILTFVPFATLVVGQLYRNDCPIQIRIPQWMTVFGAVGFSVFSFLIIIAVLTVKCCSGNIDWGRICGSCILFLLLLFFLGWLIAGSVWLFPFHSKVQFNQTIFENYCQEILYKFTFITLLAQYSLIGLFICCGVLSVLITKFCD